MADDITELLGAWSGGDRAALDRLMPLVYAELRRLADRQLSRERREHTLQATALVNEAYLRLVDMGAVDWNGRAHFFAMSARLMRRILVDHARSRRYQKRGGGAQRESFDEEVTIATAPGTDLVTLDDALQALAVIDRRI